MVDTLYEEVVRSQMEASIYFVKEEEGMTYLEVVPSLKEEDMPCLEAVLSLKEEDMPCLEAVLSLVAEGRSCLAPGLGYLDQDMMNSAPQLYLGANMLFLVELVL